MYWTKSGCWWWMMGAQIWLWVSGGRWGGSFQRFSVEKGEDETMDGGEVVDEDNG